MGDYFKLCNNLPLFTSTTILSRLFLGVVECINFMKKTDLQSYTGATLKIYWKFTKKYPILLALTLLGIIAGAATNAIIPIFFKQLFDALSTLPQIASSTGPLIKILILIAIMELIHWFFWRISEFSASISASKIIKELSDYCFAYLHKHSLTFFNNNFGGSLTKRVNRFSRSYEAITDRIQYDFIPLFVNVILIVCILTWRNIYIGLGLLAWVLIFTSVNFLFSRYKLPYDLERSSADTATTGILADTITNEINVKLFNGYGREVKNYGNATEKLRRLRLFTWLMGSGFFAIQGLLITILEITLFYVAIKLWVIDKFTIGDFVLIQSYIIIVIGKVWDFGRVIQRTYEDLSDANEMTEILLTPNEITDAPGAKKLIVKSGRIEFKDVDFYYNETRAVLQKFNLNIAPGEKVALVGPSGAGKSTIVRLILRLHDVSGGEIDIDGQNIAHAQLESLWSAVSQVPQDPILFHRSLSDNIRYGASNATIKEVEKAANFAHCDEFIKDLSEKFNTFVGERGVKLSGGERQRVAIARAILHNSPILVLDEATSSLDSESERLIQDALDKLIKGKTVIVVAHRLSTIMKMDRIIVIDGGKIAEQGSHNELLKKTDGIYRNLWSVQAGGFIK